MGKRKSTTFVNTNRHKVYCDDPLGNQPETVGGVYRFAPHGEVTVDADDPIAPRLASCAGVVEKSKEATDEIKHEDEVLLAGPGPNAFPAAVAAGDTPADEAPGAEPVDYSKLPVKDLKARAAERGVEAKGTGSGGKAIKKDYVKALKKADESAGGTLTSASVPTP